MHTAIKVARFVPSYVWLRIALATYLTKTFYPTGIKWRWRHPYSWGH